MLLCLKEDAPILNWPSSKLGCRGGSFEDEAWFLACLRLIWAKHPRTARRSLCAVLLAIWFCTSTSAFSQVGPGSLVVFAQSASETSPPSTGRPMRSRTPSRGLCTGGAPLLRSQRLGTSQTRERWGKNCIMQVCGLQPENILPMLALMRSPATSVDTVCLWVPWRAWDGCPLLRGKPFHGPWGKTCLLRGQRADWDTVGSISEQQSTVFRCLQSRQVVYFGTAPCFVQRTRCCAMDVGLGYGPPCCVRHCTDMCRRGQAVR